MKDFLKLALVCACLSGTGQALCATSPSPEALAAARRLIHASGGDDRILGPVPLPNDTSIMADCLAEAASNPERKVSCDDAVKDAHRAFQQAVAIRESKKSEILYAAELAYVANLSVEDMRAAATFFESPAGRRLIAAGPAIAMEYETANRNIMTGVVAGSDEAADRIYYVSGGLMSAHTELQIDLESGDYALTEPKNGAFVPEETYEGRLSADHLAKIRGLAGKVARTGFKTAECLQADQKEARRRARLQARARQIVLDLPPMDAQLSFLVRADGLAQSAPRNEDCWTDDAKALEREMFADAHSDRGSQ